MRLHKAMARGGALALAFSCGCLMAQSDTPQEKKNLNTAVKCWREIVTFGHADMASKCMAADYIEHDPNMGGNLASFVAFVGKTPARPVKAEPKPGVAFAKGDFVVLAWQRDSTDKTGKAYQYTTFDILRMNNGKIQEHWDAEKRDPASAVTVLPPAAPITAQFTLSPEEQKTQELVLDLYRDVLGYHHFELASKYMAADYIQHNYTDPQGRDGLMEELGKRFKPEPLQPEMKNKPALTITQGDIVLMMSTRMVKDANDPSKNYNQNHFEMVRVQNGIAQEHWDSSIGAGGARN